MSREEDAYVIERMGKLLAEIAIIVNGTQPHDTLWSYHDLPEKVRALKQAPPAPAVPDAVEAAARAMATFSGWSGWDSATSCADTLSGNEPEEEREHFIALARVALTAAQG